MSTHPVDFDNPDHREQARRRLYPAYRVAAERVEDWKAREHRAAERRRDAGNPLSWLFWQLSYLSAVGNGAEAARCRDGLFDPHWGTIDEACPRTSAAADAIAIRKYNEKTHGL